MPRPLIFVAFLALLALLARPAFAEGVKLGTYMAYARPSVLLESEGGEPAFELEPDGTTRSGVELRYRGYGVSFSVPFADLSSPDRLSQSLGDFRAFYHGDAWGFEGYFRDIRGFSAQTAGPGSALLARPDMRLTSTRAAAYRAVGRDSRVYRLSEGLTTPGMEPDVYMTFGLARDRLRDTEAFLRESGLTESPFYGVRDLDVYSFSVGGGFALSTNLSGLYFDPALFGGLGAQYRRSQGWEERSGMSWGLVNVGLRMRMGYRNRFFDVGGGFENDAHVVTGESAIFNALLARAQVQVYL